jgi:hypothetical protein
MIVTLCLSKHTLWYVNDAALIRRNRYVFPCLKVNVSKEQPQDDEALAVVMLQVAFVPLTAQYS